jgi:LmbE family N-acetylglucosaminyl deacetylase
VPDDEPVARLAALIDEVRPDTVLTFGPDGQTLHPDHISVSRWTTWAVDAAGHQPDLLYAAMTPEWLAFASEIVSLEDVMMVPGAEPEATDPADLAVAFVAEGDLLDRKVRALRHQHSQVGGLVEQIGVETFARFVADEPFRRPRPHDWPR